MSLVAAAAVATTVAVPLWAPAVALVDVVRGRRRLPTLRLGLFGAAWLWLEVAGVGRATWLFVTGRSRDLAAHYALQRWWVTRLMAALRATTGLRVELADGAADVLRPGPVVVLCRHCSLADSLVSAWIVSEEARLRPHYVLKRELLGVPNLDIVGNRLPNVFVDRTGSGSADVERLQTAARRLGPDDAIVIFPEGTRATDAKRERALERIAAADPERAERLSDLRRLIPPHTTGTTALLAGAPTADVVVAGHRGLDGLVSFAAVRDHLAAPPPPVIVTLERTPRSLVPAGRGFARWLDERWLTIDRWVTTSGGTP